MVDRRLVVSDGWDGWRRVGRVAVGGRTDGRVNKT